MWKGNVQKKKTLALDIFTWPFAVILYDHVWYLYQMSTPVSYTAVPFISKNTRETPNPSLFFSLYHLLCLASRPVFGRCLWKLRLWGGTRFYCLIYVHGFVMVFSGLRFLLDVNVIVCTSCRKESIDAQSKHCTFTRILIYHLLIKAWRPKFVFKLIHYCVLYTAVKQI